MTNCIVKSQEEHDCTGICHMKNLHHPVMIVHGPEIFDRGHVQWLMEVIRPRKTIVAGVMARTAAEESGLAVEYAEMPPSYVIRKIKGPVFLANCGKTADSGKIFGEIIAGKLGETGLVHVECSDQMIYVWNGGDNSLATNLSENTGYGRTEVITQVRNSASVPRKIRGCLPGEPVFVNGFVIGYATGDTVVIRARDGYIEPISGIHIKAHGIEKLRRMGPLDPGEAWCKSGVVRKYRQSPGIYTPAGLKYGRIITIDHCAIDIYRHLGGGVCGVLAIGDDTTAICAHICSHLGVPVFGITDGDEDVIIDKEYAKGSVVILVTSGSDDELGREISANVVPGPVEWDSWVRSQVEQVGNRGHIVFP